MQSFYARSLSRALSNVVSLHLVGLSANAAARCVSLTFEIALHVASLMCCLCLCRCRCFSLCRCFAFATSFYVISADCLRLCLLSFFAVTSSSSSSPHTHAHTHMCHKLLGILLHTQHIGQKKRGAYFARLF